MGLDVGFIGGLGPVDYFFRFIQLVVNIWIILNSVPICQYPYDFSYYKQELILLQFCQGDQSIRNYLDLFYLFS